MSIGIIEQLRGIIDTFAELEAEIEVLTEERDAARAILSDIRDGVYYTDRTIRPHAVPLNQCDSLKGLMGLIDQQLDNERGKPYE